ncbi:hypothetical protein XELAEV_18011774mg [Xenopus laevis]|uniref:Uncharacterized protein n=1 Tax=Xenopus laevis TaxID=8355 RepID=A0A974DLF2_XENLA|nr:hypothetical protein XELAEV_18011774mg [Xenopus laevis]
MKKKIEKGREVCYEQDRGEFFSAPAVFHCKAPLYMHQLHIQDAAREGGGGGGDRRKSLCISQVSCNEGSDGVFLALYRYVKKNSWVLTLPNA